MQANQIPLTKLNVGCGKSIMEPPWCNLDAVQLEGVDCVFDLNNCGRPDELLKYSGQSSKTPFADNTFDEILMSHILEHLPRPLDVMQELHRIAKPDALLTVRVPFGSTDVAFEDPQHIRQYFLQSFEYFGQPCYWKADYGYRGDWQTKSRTLVLNRRNKIVANFESDLDELMAMIMSIRNVVLEFYVELVCIKPIRAMDRTLAKASPVGLSFVDTAE